MLTLRHFRSTTSATCLCRNWRVCKNAPVHRSTSNVPTTDEKKKLEVRPQYPLLDTEFNQYRIAYHYRRTLELLRGYLVYHLFSISFLVNNQDKIAHWGRHILGDRLFNATLKFTAFGHFVGGETPQEIEPIIKRLQTYNVKPILDYSVESDEGDSSASYDDHSRRMHDQNTDKFIECIKTSHNVCGPNNLVAIKVTALIRPHVLKKFNTLLKSIKDRSSLPSLFESLNRDNVKNTTNLLPDQTFDTSLLTTQSAVDSTVALANDDMNEVHQLLVRLNKIAQASVESKISMMVDAEQTYFQTAINYLATELQRYYNKNGVPNIYGTYQCYLKETLDSVTKDLALAEKDGYIFAAKLVRGAYIEQERRLARENGYEDPINPNVEATTQMYHACLDEVLKSIVKRKRDQVRIMVASHNEDTIRYGIQQMKNHDIRRGSSIVSFASLYGMSDYITFALANSGYKTYKYLPYGPIEALQPYLFRRAQENRAIFEKAEKDRRFHLKALKDRLLSSKT